MKVRIVDEADDELQHAAQWYEQRVAGLGHSFLDNVLDAFDEILKHPRRYPRYVTRGTREIRKLLLDTFPYTIVYEMINNRPVVLAVAHGARRPRYWKKRRAK